MMNGAKNATRIASASIAVELSNRLDHLYVIASSSM
jgi:hypothetical protein